jgi:hypothetical protein
LIVSTILFVSPYLLQAPYYAEQQLPDQKDQMARLKAIAARLQLSAGAITALRQLSGYDIVVIADDSGSMRNPAHKPNEDDPFEVIPSRWDELRQRLTSIVEVQAVLSV